ncbi:autotransporter outer membrane beta-barrel domain-containing protein [Parvularcula oceani]|uniref:autotransporter family protein n=1 Tax=Parvularcula oceani TaxID=1247963 RepID=UPI00056C9741|nr:autotransporter outer membrane beta-barrel domain-containing protein [Parvularcula oceani]
MTDAMHRRGLRLALLSGAAFCWAGPAAAQQTEIDGDRTTTVRTSAAGDVTITENGSITVGQTPALVIDADAEVVNDGAILVETEAEGGAGVLITGDITGSYTQNGSLDVLSAIDTVQDEAPGQFPAGRYGLSLSEGSSLTGDLTFESASGIAVESAAGGGIAIAGTLDGDLVMDGVVSVQGEEATGISVTGAVSGDLSFGPASTIEAIGVNADGLSIDGPVAGGITLGGAVRASGFTDQVGDPDDDDSDDIDQSALAAGDAVAIRGDVGGGVLVNAAADAATGNGGRLSVRGSGNALYVGGGAQIGLTAGIPDDPDTDEDESDDGARGEFAIVNRGTISTDAIYNGVTAEAARIEDASLAGGFANEGEISAVGRREQAVALVFGNGAQVPTLSNAGTIGVGATSLDRDGIGVLLEDGARVPEVVNSGRIEVQISSDAGDAVAFRDESGTVTRFVNTGALTTVLRDFDDGNDATDADEGEPVGNGIALDLSRNTSGVEIVNRGAGNMVGNVLTGSGDDVFRAAGGTSTGAIRLGGGMDQLILTQSALVRGSVFLGGGSDTVSVAASTLQAGLDFGGGGGTFGLTNGATFQGDLNGAEGVDLTLDASSSAFFLGEGPSALGSLTTAAGTDANGEAQASVLGFRIDAAGETVSSLDVSGDAILADGTQIRTLFSAAFADDLSAPIITAGGVLAADAGSLVLNPAGQETFLFEQSLRRDGQSLILNLRRKSAAELGIAPARAAAYEPVIRSLVQDTDLGAAVFNATTQEEFLAGFDQFLGAPLEAPLTYARVQNSSVTSLVNQRVDRLRDDAGRERHIWLQEESFFVDRQGDETLRGFDGGGFVVTGGVDTALGPIDTIGVTASLASARYDEETGEDFPFNRLAYGGGVYIADQLGPLQLDARADYAWVNSESERNVVVGNARRAASAEWDGTQVAAHARARYEASLGGFEVMPFVSVDYLKLEEDAYTEVSGQGGAIGLTVDEREATSLRGNAGVTVGRRYELQPSTYDTSIPGVITPTLTAAWSQELDSDDLTATYRFGEGDPFTLAAEKEDGAAIVAADFGYENEYARLGAGISGTFGEDTQIYALRLGLGLKW